MALPQQRKYRSFQEMMDSLKERIAANRAAQVNGIGLTPSDKKIECEVCQDEEYFQFKNEVGEWKYTNCEACFVKKRVERLFRASKITEEDRRKAFYNFIIDGKGDNITNAYRKSLEYAEKFESMITDRNNSIALLGKSGSGKTHLLCAIANRLIGQGVNVVYFSYVDGLTDIKGDWDKAQQKIYELKQAEVLLLDDLWKGRPTPTDWQFETIFDIINERYRNFSPIMVSSEWTLKQMMSLDEALGSRIYEMCKRYTVQLNGTNELNHRIYGAV